MFKNKILLFGVLGLALSIALTLALIPPAGGRGRIYGKPIDQMAGTPVELAQLFARTDDYVGKNIIVEARIGMVCQTSGCWITLSDGANQLLVQFYDFTVRLSPDARVRVGGQIRLRNKAPYLAGRGLEVLG
jgi:hypothetical protein